MVSELIIVLRFTVHEEYFIEPCSIVNEEIWINTINYIFTTLWFTVTAMDANPLNFVSLV